VILISVSDGMCCGYRGGLVALYTIVDVSDALITSSTVVPAMSSTKSMRNVSCIVSRMTLTLYTHSARMAIVTSQGSLSSE
jgi:hypothetical protein